MTIYKDFTVADIEKIRAGTAEWGYFPTQIGLDALKKIEAMKLQNDELKKLLVRVYARHLPDVCDCDEPADGPHSKECISTRVAEVSLQALTERRDEAPRKITHCFVVTLGCMKGVDCCCPCSTCAPITRL